MTTEDTTPKTTSTSSAPTPLIKPVMKAKPPVVGKIQGKGLKVAPPRMNNSPRGR